MPKLLPVPAMTKSKPTKAVAATMDDWRPYFEKTSAYHRGDGSTQWQWEQTTKDRYDIVTRSCADLECKRGRAARAIEEWRVPQEEYQALLRWGVRAW